jgi:hypothetical protein
MKITHLRHVRPDSARGSWHRGLRRFGLAAAAFLPIAGLATLAGTSVLAQSAAAGPPATPNLVADGSFEGSTAAPGSYLTVPAGNSTLIPGWTVVTPSIYGPSNGSVDVVSSTYNNWGAEDKSFSIDLGGTSSEAGGIYQDVATTPGVEYSLSYWTAVNGDQAPGFSHTMNVVVGPTPTMASPDPSTTVTPVTAFSAGTPLAWVNQTATITATSTSTRLEFDDNTLGDTNQGPALDNVSLMEVPDVITAAAATISAQTTAKSFTVPLATFTDSYLGLPADFSVSVAWGDGTTTTTTSAVNPVTISQTGPTSFTIGGTHTYALHATYAPTVTITSIAGTTATVSPSPSVVVADAVTTCAGSGCSGTLMTPQQTLGISSTSTAGSIQTDVDPANNSTSCGDAFRHAPQVTTVTDIGLNANIVYTVTFANKAAAGSWLVPFAVCYQSPTAFKDLYGHTVTTGLLPLCTLLPRPGKPLVAPCVQSIVELPLYVGNVVEKIVLPAGDPRFH